MVRRCRVALCTSKNRRTSRPELTVSDAQPVDQFRRGELAFDVIDEGPAEGPVVVLLHGFPQSNASWAPVIQLLAGRGYRCIAPNQRGCSPGARPPRIRDYRVPELVEDVRALINASDAERVHVVGHDWGAMVAWAVAAAIPERLHSVTAISVPHPAASVRALMTSRQAVASWFVYFFHLPRIPERLLLGSDGKAAGLSRLMQWFGQPSDAADRDARAMSESGALTSGLIGTAQTCRRSSLKPGKGHRSDDVRVESR